MFFQAAMVLLMFLSVEVQADTLDDIIERGTLRVGVSLFEPWTMKDKSGKLSGYEIDVTKKVAHDLDVKPEFIVYEWEDIMLALKKGEIDIIAGGMAITPARALKINFSNPYADSGISLATNSKMTRNIKSLEELNQKDIIISGVSGSISYELATRLFKKAPSSCRDCNARACRYSRATLCLRSILGCSFVNCLKYSFILIPSSNL